MADMVVNQTQFDELWAPPGPYPARKLFLMMSGQIRYLRIRNGVGSYGQETLRASFLLLAAGTLALLVRVIHAALG